MALVSAQDLVQLRADQALGMPDTCTRTRITWSDDGQGRPSESTATTNYACRMRAGGNAPTEVVEGGKLTGTAVWWVSLPHNADVNNDDKLTINSKTLQVLGAWPDPTWDTVTRVFCQETS